MEKLSELDPNTYVDCNGEVMRAEKAVAIAKSGIPVEIYLITNEHKEKILKKSFEEWKNGICSDKLSATKDGEEVRSDICSFCGEIIDFKRYKGFLNGQKA